MQAEREILKACATISDMLLNIFVKGTPVGVSFAFRKTGAALLWRIREIMKDFNYRSSAWKRKRLHILRRDKYLCQDCIRYGRRREATTVHHIKHADEYPQLAFCDDNLISLCEACHNKRHPEKGSRSHTPSPTRRFF